MKRTTLKTRLWALAATLLLLISLLALPVSAAINTTASNGKITFQKHLVMDKEANVPNVTFEFTIAAGQAATYGEEGTVKTAVYAGIMGENAPVIYAGNSKPEKDEDYGKVTFAAGDDTTDITPVEPEAAVTQKEATKNLTVDFTGVTFPAPGIYRYVITETNGGSSGITYDDSRTLDVYVQYKKNSETGEGQPEYTDELEVAYYVLQDGTAGNPDTATDAEDGTKSDGFTNTYATQNLTLKKEVEGNQGDKNKYFKFTVKISGATKGNKYTVDLTHADTTISSLQHTNPSELIVSEDGTVSGTYYLKNDQYIVIQGLTSDTQYKITEDNSYKNDGYSTTYKIGEAEAEPGLSTPDDATVGNTDISVVFTNTKNGTVPTGILLETAPYLILGAVVVAGLVVLFATRRRRARE